MKRVTLAQLRSDPWVRIQMAIMNGRGIRLSADDVFKIAVDDALRSAALEYLHQNGAMFSPTNEIVWIARAGGGA